MSGPQGLRQLQAPEVAKVIFDILEQRHGAIYARSRCEEMAGMGPAEVMGWAAVSLDPCNRVALAGRLGLDPACMRMLARVMEAARRVRYVPSAPVAGALL